MTSRSSIVEKTSTFPTEMIHIMLGCVIHFQGHQNKMVPLLKAFIFVDLSNGVKFRNCTCWSTNDIQSHHLLHQVSKHHISNKDMVLSGHVEINM